MDGKLILLLAVLVICLMQISSALPDSSTSASGNVCTRWHGLRYSYSVNAPKSVQVGDMFSVSLDFSLSTESRLRRAPTQTTATLSGSNVELLCGAKQQCSNTGTWQLRATEAGTAKLSFATVFFINGDDRAHRGYKATFRDNVDFTITVTEKPPETPAPPSVETPANLTPQVNDTPELNRTPQVNDAPKLNQTPAPEVPVSPPQDSIESDNTQVITVEFEGDFGEVGDTSWITTRVVGLLAYLMLFLSIMTALLKKSRYNMRLTILFKYHHDISIMSLLLALFHGLSNIFDKYTWDLSPYGVFFPRFGSDTQLWISIGIFAFYLMAIVTLTSLGGLVIRKLGVKKWKFIHMASYLAFFFVFAHSLLLGTDLQQGLLLYLFWASGFIIFVLSADILVCKILGVKK